MAKEGKCQGSERRKHSTTDQPRSQFVYTSTWSADANSLTDRPRCSGRSQGARTVERGDVGQRLLGVTTHVRPHWALRSGQGEDARHALIIHYHRGGRHGRRSGLTNQRASLRQMSAFGRRAWGRRRLSNRVNRGEVTNLPALLCASYQPSSPSSSWKVPVGPSGLMRASRATTRALSAAGRPGLLPGSPQPSSVAVMPGSTALT